MWLSKPAPLPQMYQPSPDIGDATTIAVLSPENATASNALLRMNPASRTELLALVERARNGDVAAQSELVHRYSRRISAFVRPILSQPSAVEDIVQGVFIRMFRRLRLLRDPRTFESWLFTLARNASLDYLRRARCRPKLIWDEDCIATTPDLDSTAVTREITEALELALLRLRPKDRKIVTLVVQGHSYSEIAESEGLSVGAVKLRLNRVRPFLRKAVGEAVGLPAREPEIASGRSRCAAAA